MSFLRTIVEALGEDYDALMARPVQALAVPAVRPPEPLTSDGYRVAYAYSPRENVGSGGRCHLITPIAISAGRLQREAGDPLCKPARKFWGLDSGRTEADFNQYGCARCGEIRKRIAKRQVA